MSFLPKNRYLLVELQQEPQKEESAVLVPEGYTPKKSGYAAVKVLKTSYDTNYTSIVKENDMAVVNREMIEEINVMSETYHVILENYILGVVG